MAALSVGLPRRLKSRITPFVYAHAKFQIYLYARALSVRTGIPLRRFGLAYFDDKDYFEVTSDTISVSTIEAR